MTIDFLDETEGRLELELEKIAEQVINAALDYCSCPYEAAISLLIVNKEEIHKLNLEHRQIDRPTDVLSFPMVDYEQAGDFDFLEEDDSCFDPETGELMLGDIVISADAVLAQAEAYGHSILREYAFLLTHSMLHLFGYDHMVAEEAARMERMQGDILETLGITR